MKLFRIGIVVAVMLLCIPRKVQAFENTICSIYHFHCIINVTYKFTFFRRYLLANLLYYEKCLVRYFIFQKVV